MQVKVEELQPGDRFVDSDGHWHYDVLRVEVEADTITAYVRFKDGGHGERYWDPGTTITIERP